VRRNVSLSMFLTPSEQTTATVLPVLYAVCDIKVDALALGW
jgi:hypothetical protein